ncbi:hypothetical protein L1987_32205 [Smallanthus sonchifolius]|uniref:Uncharacterized protein n=1 Tax=Smallanthus sonchifolius TaxID=185202 RepID=A0ACB9I7J1_9ASTR|nr:hypothetical protein L1987_32205 [Smallanthus sonchifolius]
MGFNTNEKDGSGKDIETYLEVKTLHKRTLLSLSVAGISFSPSSSGAQRPSISSASSPTAALCINVICQSEVAFLDGKLNLIWMNR